MRSFRILNILKEQSMHCQVCGSPVPVNDISGLCFRCSAAMLKKSDEAKKIYADASHDVELKTIVVEA